MTDATPWIVDVDAHTFEREVVERSHSVPVVLDFWAAWCEPCKTLGPLLERHAKEGNGRFLLAKIDVDANPELAQAFRVQGIPAVLAIAGGKLVDGFQGAVPPDEVAAFLERVAPGGPGGSSVVAQAEALVEEGDPDGARALLRDHLRDAPKDDEARLRLGELLADAQKPQEADKVLVKLSAEAAEGERARTLRSRIEFAQNAGDLDQLRSGVEVAPEDPAARVALGKALIAGQEHGAGLEELLEAVRLDPSKDSEAHKAMLEAFELLGLEDPIANEYRFKLSLLLFA